MGKETNGEKKFWTLQNKILILAGTVSTVIGAIFAVSASSKAIDSSVKSYIRPVAREEARNLDSQNCVKRAPIDEMILSQLKAIRMDQKKTAFTLEKKYSKDEWARINAQWRSDSLRNEKYQ